MNPWRFPTRAEWQQEQSRAVFWDYCDADHAWTAWWRYPNRDGCYRICLTCRLGEHTDQEPIGPSLLSEGWSV